MEDPDIDPSLQAFTLLLSAFQGPISPGIIAGLILIILLLILSAAISGSEIAFFSLSPNQLNDLKTDTGKKSRTIQLLLEKPKRLLATILIANNFVNVAIIIISSYLMIGLFDFSDSPLLGFLVQVVIVTALILMFGEIMPKIFATQHAVAMAYFMAQPMLVLRGIFSP